MKNYFEIKLLYKENDYREEIDVMEEVKIDPQGLYNQTVSIHGSMKISQSSIRECRDRKKVKSSLWDNS